MKRDDKLVRGSMGSWLTPPNHPSQTCEVETDIRCKKENRGAINIEYALEKDDVSQQTKNEIRNLLTEWENNKPSLDSEATQKWLKDCQRHFAGLPQQLEAYVRKYYPEFKNITL